MNRFAMMSLAALLALPAIGCAQQPKENADAGRHTAKADKRQLSNTQDQHENEGGARRGGKAQRRLESVTWNSVKHQLTWVISKGAAGEQNGNGPAEKKGQDQYEINMDNATMKYNGEIRRFSKEEASNVHMLMDLISKYAVDSTIWWDQGQGQKLDGEGQPVDGGRDDGKVKVLRVSAPADTETEIRMLERRLRELRAKQLKPAKY